MKNVKNQLSKDGLIFPKMANIAGDYSKLFGFFSYMYCILDLQRHMGQPLIIDFETVGRNTTDTIAQKV